MKSGTTSLFFDLLTHPGIFLPDDKEPHSLADDEVLSPQGREKYTQLFASANAAQICGEASTGYTKRPDIQNVPERAQEICGPSLKVIYQVREPVARLISHHYHEFTAGKVGRNINQVVREHPEFINYSRYAHQIHPWLQTFGSEQVKVVRFEDYVADRSGAVSELVAFLGVDSGELDSNLLAEVYNRSEGKPAPRGRMWRVTRRSWYRRWVRPLLSTKMRRRLTGYLLPAAPDRPEPPSHNTVAWILDQLAEDNRLLQQIMGLSSPVWDDDAVLRAYETNEKPDA